MDCLTASTVLTIAGGALGLAGAIAVVLDVVDQRRKGDRFRAELEPVVAQALKAQPARPMAGESTDERLAALENAVRQLEQSVSAAILKLRQELNVQIDKVAATARSEIAQQQRLTGATVRFITGHGVLRISGAILVVVSIILATAGGVVANRCASPSSPNPKQLTAPAAHAGPLGGPATPLGDQRLTAATARVAAISPRRTPGKSVRPTASASGSRALAARSRSNTCPHPRISRPPPAPPGLATARFGHTPDWPA